MKPLYEHYYIDFSKEAKRDLKSIIVTGDLVQEIDALADNPYPPGSILMRKYMDTWRLRVGRYRIVYRVRGNLVKILRVELRTGKTYRGFKNPEWEACNSVLEGEF